METTLICRQCSVRTQATISDGFVARLENPSKAVELSFHAATPGWTLVLERLKLTSVCPDCEV